MVSQRRFLLVTLDAAGDEALLRRARDFASRLDLPTGLGRAIEVLEHLERA